jgi:pimeloyl-ACP methyl ester carboxylesterase
MATEIILPRVDMDMTTGRIARWYIEEGAPVEKGQPLFEIETSKAAMEIEAPNSGILRKLTAASSEEIAVGSTVGWIYAPGETPAPAPAQTLAPTLAPPPASKPSVETPGATELAQKAPMPAVSPMPAAEAVTATPLARRLARQHDIALKGIIGSGPRGRIQARDVETAVLAGVRSGAVSAEIPTVTGDDALYRTWLRQGEGRPLVLVHGFGADLNTWRPLIGSLRTNRPILGIDLPGHGRSPAAASPSLAGFAEAVADALVAEGIDSADLIGHSLGAAVVTRLADGATFDLRSLFLIAPAGLHPGPQRSEPWPLATSSGGGRGGHQPGVHPRNRTIPGSGRRHRRAARGRAGALSRWHASLFDRRDPGAARHAHPRGVRHRRPDHSGARRRQPAGACRRPSFQGHRPYAAYRSHPDPRPYPVTPSARLGLRVMSCASLAPVLRPSRTQEPGGPPIGCRSAAHCPTRP